ncbi:MAG: Fe-S cluster assembly protein SufD, partial [Waddliaceae bacterium]
IVVTPLAKAMHTYGAYLNNQWATAMKEETDPFAAMNAALNRDGAFLYLPPKTLVDIPVQILFVADSRDIPMLMLPRIHTFVGAQSQIEFVSTHVTLSGESFFTNRHAEWIIEEGAQVKNIQIKRGNPGKAWLFDTMRTTLKRDSSFHAVSLTDGFATVRHDYRIALIEENAEALLNGVWLLRDKREAHTNVYMDHQAPNCRSKQVFKGVLDDSSRSSFEGKIYVRPEAQKTEAYQYNHNLLLSDSANADCKPHLEIFADDVKASHGATVGQLDKEQLFFLKARGFSEKEARNLLIQGFFQEMIDLIKIPSLKERCNTGKK